MRFFSAATPGAAVALALSLAACGDGGGPSDPPVVPPEIAAPAAEVEAFLPALFDEQLRVIPALEDRATARELNDRLERLSALLRQRDARAAAAEVELLRAALRYYGPTLEIRTADGGELGALELQIDRSAALIGMAALPNRLPSGD